MGRRKVQLGPDVIYGLARGDFEGRTKLTRSIRKRNGGGRSVKQYIGTFILRLSRRFTRGEPLYSWTWAKKKKNKNRTLSMMDIIVILNRRRAGCRKYQDRCKI